MKNIEREFQAALPMAELDRGFGKEGVAFIRPANPAYIDMVVEHVITAADGKIYVTGTDLHKEGGVRLYMIAAFNADGSAVTSFGDGGVVRRSFYQHDDGLAEAMGKRVFPLDDGNLLVLGTVQVDRDSAIHYFAMAKMDTQGRLITEFGNGGNVIIPLLDNGEEYPTRFIRGLGTALHDGWLYISARLNKPIPGEDTAFWGYTGIFKVSLEGVQDQGFGGHGAILTSGPEFTDGYNCGPVVSAQDRLTVLGKKTAEIHPYDRWVMERYFLDGTVDKEFGDQGRIVDHEAPVNIVLNTHLLYSRSGQWLAHIGAGAGQEARMLRVDGNQLDPSFGEAGVVRIPPVDFSGIQELQGEERMVAVSSGGPVEVMGRLLATGQLDPEFGDNGYASIRLPSSDQRVDGVENDASGGVLVYGQLGLDGEIGCYLARYLVR